MKITNILFGLLLILFSGCENIEREKELGRLSDRYMLLGGAYRYLSDSIKDHIFTTYINHERLDDTAINISLYKRWNDSAKFYFEKQSEVFSERVKMWN